MKAKAKQWFLGLSKAKKVVVIGGALFLLGMMIAPTSANTQPPEQPVQSGEVKGAEEEKPVIETKTVTTTEEVPFEKTTTNDATLAKGKTAVRTAGVNGVKTHTYNVTYTDGKETDRELVSSEITTQPVAEVTAIGTYVYVAPAPAPKPAPAPAPQASNCHPNYGGCVPIASDVDCGGGSGNGPAYAWGPFAVLGPDVYDLDRDGDGIACE